METREQKFKRLFPWVDPKYAGFPWSDPEELSKVELPKDVADFKAELMAEFITPFGLPWLPGYVLKELVEAANVENPDRREKLEHARSLAHTSYLADMARGRIKTKDETSEPMPDDVKQHLKELNENRRKEKAALKSRVDSIDKQVAVKSTKEPKKDGSPKVSVYSDVNAQDALRIKYPWARTFKQDPAKQGGTLVTIACVVCGGERELHLADLFHSSKCRECQKKKLVKKA